MDNLPENLQNSVKYEEFETAVEALDDALSSMPAINWKNSLTMPKRR